jgi:hypothetical protein
MGRSTELAQLLLDRLEIIAQPMNLRILNLHERVKM